MPGFSATFVAYFHFAQVNKSKYGVIITFVCIQIKILCAQLKKS